MPKISHRNKVFISYSHADIGWLKRLQVHLKPLEREFQTEIWDDTHIQPGDQWRTEIDTALQEARAVILLISADFLASEFINTHELPNVLEKSRREGAHIFCLILSPSRFKRTKLSEFQAVNSPDNPITSMSHNDQEATFDKVAEMIEGIFETRGAGTSSTSVSEEVPDESGGFFDKREINEIITHSGMLYENEEIEKNLLIYSTEAQKTWLVSTGKRIFCILNEKGTLKSNQSITWVADKESLSPIGTRKYKKYSGLLDLQNHAGWLYSYRLFPTPDDLIGKVNDLLA
jgi:hypothetical protein